MFKENENKKKLIILGGNNNCNITWLRKMEKAYKKDYNVNCIYFDNWTSNTDVDFDNELKKLINITSTLDNYTIIAKSAGAILSLKGIVENKINPDKLVVMGVPLLYYKEKGIDVFNLFNNSAKKSKILVIQQKYDPQGSASSVKEILSQNIRFICINGNHHTYQKVEDIKTFVDDFIN